MTDDVLCVEYADSSFYDDNSHNYPTLDEQMKMARKVAQSLTAPANEATRGHRMFMKRKEKSVHWTVDDSNRRRHSVDTDLGDLYYNPAPWKATATWKPRPAHDDLAVAKLAPVPRLFAPRVPSLASDEKAKYMSADEFERMRLFEDKTTHDTVSPQLCFNLAADLRQSTSKGARMFAKRRAKADQWTVGPDLQVTIIITLSFIFFCLLDAGYDVTNLRFWIRAVLTLSPPTSLRLDTLPYWSNPPFLIFDIRALWRSGLRQSARMSKIKNGGLKIGGLKIG